MAFITLREITTGAFVLVNTEQITRVYSVKNSWPSGPIKTSRVLEVEVAGSPRLSTFVPVSDAGEPLSEHADDEAVIRGFAGFLAASRR